MTNLLHIYINDELNDFLSVGAHQTGLSVPIFARTLLFQEMRSRKAEQEKIMIQHRGDATLLDEEQEGEDDE